MKTIPVTLLVAGLIAAPLSTAVFAQESSVGRYVDDASITARVKGRFVEDPTVSAMRINVETKNGIVQISGFANSELEKARAASIASSVPDVRQVKNEIIVKNEATSGSTDDRSMRSGQGSDSDDSRDSSKGSSRESSGESSGSSSGSKGSRDDSSSTGSGTSSGRY